MLQTGTQVFIPELTAFYNCKDVKTATVFINVCATILAGPFYNAARQAHYVVQHPSGIALAPLQAMRNIAENDKP